MRISTAQFYSQNIQMMNDQQAQLSELYQEVASGNALTTPADDPLAAAQAVKLSATSSALAQYTSNQSTALTSLQLEDSTLSSVNTTLNSIYSSITAAGNGTLSDSDRQALATQISGQRDQLLQLANTTDGSGNYLFAGFQANTAPFTNAAGGGVTYNGDSGQREVQITSNRAVSQGDPGSSVFLSVASAGSLPVPSAGDNSGTGTIGSVTVTDPTNATNAHTFTITFGGTTSAPTYTVTDNSVDPPTTSDPQAYTDGANITLGGQSVAVSGTPAAGDTFSVTPAQQAGTDVFAALDSIISALNAPVGSSNAASATLQNALATGASKVMNSITNVLTVQASVGGRESEIKAMQSVTSANATSVSNNLSDLTQSDMATSISQMLQTSNALTAAQEAFAKVQSLSLFQYMN